MGRSKIEYGGDVLIDLTNDTTTAETTLAGYTGHSADGEPFSGNVDLSVYATTAYVDGQVDVLESSISGLSQTVNTQGESITSLQSQVSSNDTDIANLQGITTTQGQSISSLQSEFGTLNQSVTTQGQSISTLQSNISTINSELSTKAKRYIYNTTLNTTWSGSAAPYTQTIAISGITTDDTPHITPIYGDNTENEMQAWSLVTRATTANGSITFYCYGDKPTISLNLQIEVIR